MSLKERLQNRKEARDNRRHTKKRMAEASIRRMQAEQASREIKHRWYMAASGNQAAEKEHFAEVAKNLKGLEEHLVMVTNFDSSDSQATRIAAALAESGLPLDTPVGLSTHEHTERDLHYEASAEALIRALRDAGFTNGPAAGEIAGLYTQTGNFSLSLRLGAQHTAEWYKELPESVMHIAIVSSLDTAEVGIPKKVSIDGTAHLFNGIVAETGLPVWKRLADRPY